VKGLGSKLSKRERFLVVLVIVAGLLFVYYQYFLTPLLAEVYEIREEVKQKEERLGSLRDSDNEIKTLLSGIEELKTKILELEYLSPVNPRRPEIVTQLEALSKAAGVKLLSVDFFMAALHGSGGGDAKEERSYIEIPVQVNISGNYDNIIHFLKQLENAKRLYSIKGFNLLSAYAKNGEALDMSIDLHAYALLTEGINEQRPVIYDFMGGIYGRDNPFAPVTE
jgi:type IV pilus assembly protein PilO